MNNCAIEFCVNHYELSFVKDEEEVVFDRIIQRLNLSICIKPEKSVIILSSTSVLVEKVDATISPVLKARSNNTLNSHASPWFHLIQTNYDNKSDTKVCYRF
jgi:hypothetical protein